MSRTLCATDLDRTLIYSRGAVAALGGDALPLVVVERYQGADASWMTAAAARSFAALHEHALVVPTTTRTPAQWQRIHLPGPPAPYAITANGGILLVDGEPDRGWGRVVDAELARVAPLDEIWTYAARVCRPDWTRTLRNAEGLFCYAVLDRERTPAGFVAESAGWAASRGWQLSLQGRKLYWVPRSLTKSAAVAEIVRRSGCDTVLAAGDSLLDADLLDTAASGIVARHGELVASGWTAPHVRVTEHVGVRAGEEIVDWFTAHAAPAHPEESDATKMQNGWPAGSA